MRAANVVTFERRSKPDRPAIDTQLAHAHRALDALIAAMHGHSVAEARDLEMFVRFQTECPEACKMIMRVIANTLERLDRE